MFSACFFSTGYIISFFSFFSKGYYEHIFIGERNFFTFFFLNIVDNVPFQFDFYTVIEYFFSILKHV